MCLWGSTNISLELAPPNALFVVFTTSEILQPDVVYSIGTACVYRRSAWNGHLVLLHWYPRYKKEEIEIFKEEIANKTPC